MVNDLELDLYPHNEAAFRAAESMIREKGRACIIHPTGTGKALIGYEFVFENPDKRFLWLSPSTYIMEEQQASILKLKPDASFDNVTYLTYAASMGVAKGTLGAGSFDFFVLDEFHHVGAPFWGDGVKAILKANPDVPILGLSATEVRYSDNGRNMADELFEGNVASKMDLSECWERHILPVPDYVKALYDVDGTVLRLSDEVQQVAGLDGSDDVAKDFRFFRTIVSRAVGLPEVFSRHLTKTDGRLIVFCRNVTSLRAVERRCRSWFEGVNGSVHPYTVYSSNPESLANYDAFKDDDSAALKVLLCIDQLNEGVHIDGIDAVVMMRPTQSPVIYYQQLGRALSASSTGSIPLVFDLVDNLETLGMYGLLSSSVAGGIRNSKPVSRWPFEGTDDPGTESDFKVTDYTCDIRSAAERLERRIAMVLNRPPKLTTDEEIDVLIKAANEGRL